jgi:Ca2+/H+ antiporter
MNRKALVFAGIFLAIALASPVFFYIEELSHFQSDLENLGPNLADDTQTSEYFHVVAQSHSMILAILVVVEVVSVVLFAISLWFALKP